MAGDAQQAVGRPCRLVGVEHDRDAARPGGRADRQHEFRKSVVRQHRIGGRHQGGRVARAGGGEPIIAVVDDGAFPLRIDADRRHRGRHARHPRAVGAVHLLDGERRDDAVADRLFPGRAAERSGETGPSAQARDRDRRIGGAAAGNDHERRGVGLGFRHRELGDPEHGVQHRDAGAKHLRGGGAQWGGAGRAALSQAQCPSPPRRAGCDGRSPSEPAP